jgi:hypothetical protein
MKVLMMILLLMVELSAVSTNELVGKWQALRQVTSNGSVTTEKEYLTLNGNHTFQILGFVSVQKGDSFIKDMRIDASGIWRVWGNTVVMVVKKVEVPNAAEIYRISQASLRNFADTFKRKYENEPILINKIMALDPNRLKWINEKDVKTEYSR